jgi:hypothetical protein
MKGKELKILWILLYRQINYTSSVCQQELKKEVILKNELGLRAAPFKAEQ